MTRRGAFLWLPLLTATLLVSACAEWRLWLDRPVWLEIPPARLGSHTAEQRLTLAWGEESRTLDAVAVCDGKLVRLTALAFGMRLATLSYDGHAFLATRHTPAALPEKRMLRDFLLITAPLDALRAALPNGWKIEETEQEGRRQRIVTEAGGEILFLIDYASASPWQGHTRLDNRREGYRLSLDSHEL